MSTIETPVVSCDEDYSYFSGEEQSSPQHDLAEPPRDRPLGAGEKRLVDAAYKAEQVLMPFTSTSSARRRVRAPEPSSDSSGETQEHPLTLLEQVRLTEKLVRQRLRRRMRIKRRRIVGRVYLSVLIGNDPDTRLKIHTVLHLEHRQSVLKVLHRFKGAEDPIKSLVYSLYARRLSGSRSEGEVFLMQQGMLEPHTMSCDVRVLMMDKSIRPLDAVLVEKRYAQCYEDHGCHCLNISIYPNVQFKQVNASQVGRAMLEYNEHTNTHFNVNYNRLVNLIGKDDREKKRVEALEELKQEDKKEILSKMKVRFNTTPSDEVSTAEPSCDAKPSPSTAIDTLTATPTPTVAATPTPTVAPPEIPSLMDIKGPIFNEEFPSLYSAIVKKTPSKPPLIQRPSVKTEPVVRSAPAKNSRPTRSSGTTKKKR